MKKRSLAAIVLLVSVLTCPMAHGATHAGGLIPAIERASAHTDLVADLLARRPASGREVAAVVHVLHVQRLLAEAALVDASTLGADAQAWGEALVALAGSLLRLADATYDAALPVATAVAEDALAANVLLLRAHASSNPAVRVALLTRAARQMYDGACALLGIPNDLEEEGEVSARLGIPNDLEEEGGESARLGIPNDLEEEGEVSARLGIPNDLEEESAQ